MKISKKNIPVGHFDREHGNAVDVATLYKQIDVVVDDKETFFWTYASFVGVLDGLDMCSVKVLFYCCLKAQWNTNVIILNKYVCEDIKKIAGLKYQTIKNTISKMNKQGILLRKGVSTYQINPRYCWKGDSSVRVKELNCLLSLKVDLTKGEGKGVTKTLMDILDKRGDK